MHRLLRGLLLAGLIVACSPAHGQTLAAVRTSRHLTCGVIQAADDWNGQDIHGNLSDFGGEICRAVAVAIIGSADGVTVTAFPAEPEALSALKAGTIQLAVGVSPSTRTAVQYGVGFGRPVFYDSQRIMVPRDSGITSLSGLRDKLICAFDMSPPELFAITHPIGADEVFGFSPSEVAAHSRTRAA